MMMKGPASLVTPVKVWAPMGHQLVERVVFGVNDTPSRELPGESADSGHRHAIEMPSTRWSAGLSDVLFAIHDEILDYEDDQETEEGEICGEEEHVMHKGAERGKGGMNFNKERTIGVLQELTYRMVQHDLTSEKDSRVADVRSFK
ncbi:hypothetical protein NDU88_002971 [Pleurodeles waltl]|uniref:Uncharacterized protein n=1 Tax=Pleurodeles waltl TaxID=8319 RepID=A0AAV7VFY2_PLEWA|nr:hypothetical protein NDU88_002971 [Pleurodeles waltl]